MENERQLIVMVDDDSAILRGGKYILSKQYNVATLSSAEKLFSFLEANTPAMILLDVVMPEMDGYETIKILKSNSKTKDIPVIFLTGRSYSNDELEGLSLGAIDYIAKPFVPALLVKRIEVHLLVQAQKQALESQRQALQNFNANLQHLVNEKTNAIVNLQKAIIKTVANMVEYRDDVTGCHVERTMRWVAIMINALRERGCDLEQIAGWNMNELLQSSQLHDVGKIAIDDRILKKPGPLDEAEFEEMKKHTTFGVQVIERIRETAEESEFLHYAKIFAESHHERWDGTGYPLGISEEKIPILGRIMAIADVYDALISERPYKKAFPHEEAVQIIRDGRGTHFDPQLTDIFVAVADQFQEDSFF
jgi:putative two-component system response regulator